MQLSIVAPFVPASTWPRWPWWSL